MSNHYKGFEAGAGRIDGGGVAGAARADNDQVAHGSMLAIEKK
jgi:hypothetical protein